MTKVLLTEDYLEDIADAIRAKLDVGAQFKPSQMAAAIQSIAPQPTLQQKSATQNGTVTPDSGYDGLSQVTVNVPNSYVAADEGKVVSNGELVAQTAHAEVTQNGTIDTTTNNSVTVNVAGGGGTTPSFLSHSTPGDVLANAYYSAFTAGANTWGDLTVTGSPTIDAAGIHTASGNGFSYDLGEANHDVTLYAIVRGYATGDLFALGSSYGLSTGNTIAFFTRYNDWFAAVWGNDTDTGVNYNTHYAVLTIAIDAQAKKAYYYINGNMSASPYKTFNNSAQVVRFNGSNSHSDRAGRFDYLFAGVVDGCEDSATILANQQDMLTFLSSGRMLIP